MRLLRGARDIFRDGIGMVGRRTKDSDIYLSGEHEQRKMAGDEAVSAAANEVAATTRQVL